MYLVQRLLCILFVIQLGLVSSAVAALQSSAQDDRSTAEQVPSGTIPSLRKVGTRGFYVLEGAFAEFDLQHAAVNIWFPNNVTHPPVMVYAHGGAGFREEDQARVELFRQNGFATISFDSYEMNGFDDWQFVTRRVANSGKQKMIQGVIEGALKFAQTHDRFDNRNITLYGGSNGGRVVLYAGSALEMSGVTAIIAEAPAATGFELGDYDIPTLITFGELDTWAGRSDEDYVWKRTYRNSPVSVEDWITARKRDGRPVTFQLYPNAGHMMFEGPLEKVSVRRGDAIAFSAYRGANKEALATYKQDVIGFAQKHRTP